MRQKGFTRNTNDRVLGGVCSGMANYMNIESWMVRLICIVLLFAAPQTGLIYILLWAVLPVRNTAGMYDEPVSNLGSSPLDLEEKDNNNLFVGLLLIGLGLIFLLHNFVIWFDWSKLWPLVLILLGLAVLFSGTKKRDGDESVQPDEVFTDEEVKDINKDDTEKNNQENQ